MIEAMKRGTPGAVDRVPRILEIIGKYPKIAKEFSQKVKGVPCWMFIRWISQMLALLDKPEGPYVVGILVEVRELLSTPRKRRYGELALLLYR